MGWLSELGHEFWWVLGEAGVWLLFGFLIAGVLHAVVPKSILEKHLGKPGIGSVIRATLVGIPLPLCSCSVIPMASALRNGGASRGASAAFAVSTPEIDVPAVSLTWALLGWPLAVARVIGSAISAMIAGILIDLFGEDRPPKAGTVKAGTSSCCSGAAPKPEPVSSCCSQEKAATSCCSEKAPEPQSCCASEEPSKSDKPNPVVRTLRYAFVTLPTDLAPWLVLGLGLTALVGVVIPDGWIEQHIGSGIGSMLLALVVGVPVYVCATSSTPLAAALVAGGLSPGAALVFLLAGPATNPATVAWAWKDLGPRSTLIYLLSIAGVALAMGFGLQAVLGGTTLEVTGEAMHEHAISWVGHAGAAGLGLLLIVGLARSVSAKMAANSAHDHGHPPADHAACESCA